jgi:hypothetical protein
MDDADDGAPLHISGPPQMAARLNQIYLEISDLCAKVEGIE